MDRAPVYEAGCSRFDPWRRRHLAVAHQDRAPPSEGGGSTFESCRRGQRPCSSTVEHAPGTGEDWVRPPARALLTIRGPPEVAGWAGVGGPALPQRGAPRAVDP